MIKRLINHHINWWKKKFELGDYKSSYRVIYPSQDPELKDDEAYILGDLEHKTFDIVFSRDSEGSIDEKLIVHELTHMLLWRLSEFSDKIINTYIGSTKAEDMAKTQKEELEDELTEHLSRIFMRLKKRN